MNFQMSILETMTYERICCFIHQLKVDAVYQLLFHFILFQLY